MIDCILTCNKVSGFLLSRRGRVYGHQMGRDENGASSDMYFQKMGQSLNKNSDNGLPLFL